MSKIDLHDYYPWYSQCSIIEVPEEVAGTLRDFTRLEAAYMRRLYRHEAHYSLDCGDGIEYLAVCRALTLEEELERRDTISRIHAAISFLPDKQAKRIYAHYILGMSKAEIARSERVSKSQITRSIKKALANLQDLFENH